MVWCDNLHCPYPVHRSGNHRFPRDCHQHYLLRVPRYSAVHCTGFVSRHRLLTQRPMLYPVELRALFSSIRKSLQNQQNYWSGQTDSNRRPSAPKADALPDCAMPRCPSFCHTKPGRSRVERGHDNTDGSGARQSSSYGPVAGNRYFELCRNSAMVAAFYEPERGTSA